MSASSRSRFRGFAVLAAMVALFVIAPAANAATTNIFNNPKDYYMAVGTSLSFGYQGAKVNACAPTGCTSPNTQFVTGFVNDFAAAMQKKDENPETIVNYGCPGETSASLLNGSGPYPTFPVTGCATYPFALHNNHPGVTQIDAAVSFLKSHKNEVSPITFDIGGNDLLALNRSCATATDVAGCIAAGAPATIGTLYTNANTALARLRAAAPRAQIIVVGLYNTAINLLPLSDVLINGGASSVNGALGAAAAGNGAQFANPWNTINNNPAFTPGPFGTNVEFNSVCSQIAICTPLQDVHPFDNGYQAMANVIFGVSGY
jgi:hypothetical protein